jgi:hypothetical protein
VVGVDPILTLTLRPSIRVGCPLATTWAKTRAPGPGRAAKATSLQQLANDAAKLS